MAQHPFWEKAVLLQSPANHFQQKLRKSTTTIKLKDVLGVAKSTLSSYVDRLEVNPPEDDVAERIIDALNKNRPPEAAEYNLSLLSGATDKFDFGYRIGMLANEIEFAIDDSYHRVRPLLSRGTTTTWTTNSQIRGLYKIIYKARANTQDSTFEYIRGALRARYVVGKQHFKGVTAKFSLPRQGNGDEDMGPVIEYNGRVSEAVFGKLFWYLNAPRQGGECDFVSITSDKIGPSDMGVYRALVSKASQGLRQKVGQTRPVFTSQALIVRESSLRWEIEDLKKPESSAFNEERWKPFNPHQDIQYDRTEKVLQTMSLEDQFRIKRNFMIGAPCVYGPGDEEFEADMKDIEARLGADPRDFLDREPFYLDDLPE